MKYLRIVVIILSVVLGVIFIIASTGKFSMNSIMYENFVRWGYHGLLMISVGVFEGFGGIMLVIPKTRHIGALLLGAVMVGAVYTHMIQNEELGSPIFPLSLLITLIFIFISHRKIERHD